MLADHPDTLNDIGCAGAIARRGKHHECTLFESLTSYGGSCASTRTFAQDASILPDETELTDTWENLESSNGWRFTEFDINGESVTGLDENGADRTYTAYGQTNIKLTVRGDAILTQDEITYLTDGDPATALVFDGFTAADRPADDFHSLKYEFFSNKILKTPKRMLIQKVELTVVDPDQQTFVDLSNVLYSGYSGAKADLSLGAITLVAKDSNGDYAEYAKSEYDSNTEIFTLQHRSSLYAMVTDNIEVRIRDPKVKISSLKIFVFDCENPAIESTGTSEEVSKLIAFANPNYENAMIGDISNNVLNMCLRLGASAINADGSPIPLADHTPVYTLLEEDGGPSETEWLTEGPCNRAGAAVDVFYTDDCLEDDKSMADLKVALIQSDEAIDSVTKAKAACAAYGMYPAYSDMTMVPFSGDNGIEMGTLYRIFKKWVEKYRSMGNAIQIVQEDTLHTQFIGWVLGAQLGEHTSSQNNPVTEVRVMGTKKQIFGPSGSPEGSEETGGFGLCSEGLYFSDKWGGSADGSFGFDQAWLNYVSGSSVAAAAEKGVIMDVTFDGLGNEGAYCSYWINDFSYQAIMCASRDEPTPDCSSLQFCDDATFTASNPEANLREQTFTFCCGRIPNDKSEGNSQSRNVNADHPMVLEWQFNLDFCLNVDPCALDPGPCGNGICTPVTSDRYFEGILESGQHSMYYTCECPVGTKLEKGDPFTYVYDNPSGEAINDFQDYTTTIGYEYSCVDVNDCEFTTCSDYGLTCVEGAMGGSTCECADKSVNAVWDGAQWTCGEPEVEVGYCEGLERERMPVGFRKVWPTNWVNGGASCSAPPCYPDSSLIEDQTWKGMWISPMWADKDPENHAAIRFDIIGDRKIKQWTLADNSIEYEVDHLFDDDPNTFFEFDHFNQSYQASDIPDSHDFQLNFYFFEKDDYVTRKKMLFDRVEITLHQSTIDRLQFGGISEPSNLPGAEYRGPKIEFDRTRIYAHINDVGFGDILDTRWDLSGEGDAPNTYEISVGSTNHSIVTDAVFLVVTDPAIRIAEVKFHFFDCESLEPKQYVNPNYEFGKILDMSSLDHSACGAFPLDPAILDKEVPLAISDGNLGLADAVNSYHHFEYSNFGGDPTYTVDLMGYKYAIIENINSGPNDIDDLEGICAQYDMTLPFGTGMESFSTSGIGQAIDYFQNTPHASWSETVPTFRVFLGIKADGADSLILSAPSATPVYYGGLPNHNDPGEWGTDLCLDDFLPGDVVENEFKLCLDQCASEDVYAALFDTGTGEYAIEYTRGASGECGMTIEQIANSPTSAIMCMKKVQTEYLCGSSINCIDETVDSNFNTYDTQCCGIAGVTSAGSGYDAHICGPSDPCSLHSCGTDHTCEEHLESRKIWDYHGDYKCNCKNGGFYYDFDGKECLLVNECADDFHSCGCTLCVDEEEGYSCACETAQSVQIDEQGDATCFECPCDMTCDNGPGLCTKREDCSVDAGQTCSGDPCDAFGLKCPVGGPYVKPGSPGWVLPDPSVLTCDGAASSDICAWDCEGEGVGWSCEQEYCFSKSDCIFRCPHGTTCMKANFWECTHPSECTQICTEEFNLDCDCPEAHTCQSSFEHPNNADAFICGTIDQCSEDPKITCQDVFKWEINSHLYKCFFDGSPNYECLDDTWDYLQENCYPPECEPVPCTATFENKERCVMGLNGTVDGVHTWEEYWAQYEAGNIESSRRRRETGSWGTIGVTINCIQGYKRDTDAGVCNDVDECSADCVADELYGLWDCFNTNALYTGFTDITCTDTVNNDCNVGFCKNIEDTNGAATADNICVKIESENETINVNNKNDHRLTPFKCVNTLGSYYIDCAHGYMKDPNTGLDPTSPDIECIDINECADSVNNEAATTSVANPLWNDVSIECTSASLCTDNEGSYSCTWECAAGVDCTGDHTYCEFDATAGPQCHCKTGYVYNAGSALSPDWKTKDVGDVSCVDVDECQGLDVDSDTVRITHNCNFDNLDDHGHQSQLCTNTDGSFYCSCLPGYDLSYDEITQQYSCTDIDECDEITYNNQVLHNCLSADYCINLDGSYTCDNECTDHTVCGDHGRCVVDHDGNLFYLMGIHNGYVDPSTDKTAKGEKCICDEGYEFNGSICDDINECSTLNYCDATDAGGAITGAIEAECENLDGGVNCYCPKGYYDNEKDPATPYLECVDINECEDGIANDPQDGDTDACNPDWASLTSVTFLDGTSVSSALGGLHCINTDGSYECLKLCSVDTCVDSTVANHPPSECEVQIIGDAATEICICPSGFEYDGALGCVDINECDNDPCDLTVTGSKCVNDIGYYHCECDNIVGNTLIGWTVGVGENAVTCTNINECTVDSDNECYSMEYCTDTDGGYDCIDPICTDTSFCGTYAPLADPNTLECFMTVDTGVAGSAVKDCRCIDGYEAKGTSGNGLICYNIDECATDQHTCTAADEECVDIMGSFFCRCPEGYEYNAAETECVKIDICDATTYPGRYPCGADQSCNWLSSSSGSWQEVSLDQGDAKCGCPICPDCKARHGDYSKCNSNLLSTDSTLVDANGYSDSMNYYDCDCQEGYEWERDGDYVLIPYSTCIDINECETEQDPCGIMPMPSRPGRSAVSLFSRSGARLQVVESRELRPVPAYQAVDSMCYSKKNPSVFLECPAGSTISVTYAAHGRWDEETCCFSSSGCPTCDINNDFNLIPYINAACKGQESCEFIVNGQTFIPDCIDSSTGDSVRAYVDIKWDCVAEVRIEESVNSGSDYTQDRICINYPGYYVCECALGYELVNGVCEDIPECTRDLHTCTHDVDECVETDGSYYCQGDCATDTDGDGYVSKADCICLECEAGCGDAGSFSYCEVSDHADARKPTQCVCQLGYEKASADPLETQCVDIPECDDATICGRSTENCDTSVNPDCALYDCIEFSGSYECRCPHGYEPDQNDPDLCIDINECTSNNHVCIDAKFCQNTMGSYECILVCDDCSGIENSHCEMNVAEDDLICVCDVGFRSEAAPGDKLAPGDCVDIDECDTTNICTDSNALCDNTFGSYNCKCPEGYELIVDFDSSDPTTTEYCVNINECDLSREFIHHCFDNQTCVDSDPGLDGSGQLYTCEDNYSCLCTDDCNNAPHTVCKMEYIAAANQGATCECEVGYDWITTGVIADGCEDVDECSDPTLNDCAGDHKICDNTIGSYECICPSGYEYGIPTGVETLNTVPCIDINECTDDTHTCDPNAQCDNTITPGSYDCSCNAGFWDSDPANPGHKCYPDCPNCSARPFMKCNNDLTNPECVCIDDTYFRLADPNDLSAGCVDINECEEQTDDCSSIQVGIPRECQNELFGFSCCCPAGSQLNELTGDCEDIDECALDIHHCHINADCDNRIFPTASYDCTCKTGYRGNGYECFKIECPTTCDPVSQECTFINDPIHNPHIWEPSCICNEPGFEQNGVDASNNPICDDVDECSTGDHNCDALFTTGGGPQAGNLPLICKNTIGSFSCECPYGFDRLSHDGDCEWIPLECAETCTAEQYCGPRDDGAGLECRCNDGLKTFVDANGTVTCEDDDECQDSSKNDCDAITEVCYNTLGSYVCPCAIGYKQQVATNGSISCVDVNECDINETGIDPCDINAECTNTQGSYFCECDEWYIGTGDICIFHTQLPCELDCDPDCGDNAECIVDGSLIGPAECACWPGFEGDPVAGCIDINECNITDICDATEICVNIIGSYSCVECPECVDYAHCAVMPDASMGCYCDEGFAPFFDPDTLEITRCVDINECEDNTIVTGCTITEYCENTHGEFECRCKTGYRRNAAGDCEDIDECQDQTHQCGPNSICDNIPYDITLFRGYECSCPPDFIGNGFDCLPDCELCGVNTDCVVLPDRSDKECNCKPGYELDASGECIDINECEREPLTSCGTNTECYNCDGDYTCDCKDGYQFDTNGFDCIDIHECADVNLHGCAAIADCIELPGSWNCECPAGFEGNGFICHEICPVIGCGDNEFCTTMTSTSAGTIFETQCLCNPGFERDATGDCIDINECDDPTQNICDDAIPVEVCINTAGSYACGCPAGYAVGGEPMLGLVRATTGDCLNINECDYDHRCHPRADCIDTDGSYTCSCTGETYGNGKDCPCLDGFAAVNETSECLDIHECDLGIHFCDVNADCENTYGSYDCECKENYFGDGLRCFETCPVCGVNAFCSFIQNTPTCECHTGYAGNPATICDDIDECETGAHICDSYLIPERCVNTIGAHTCECPIGYKGEGDGDCVNINECVDDLHNCDVDADCIDTEGSFACECKDGFLGNGCFCHPICTNTTCGPNAHCTLADNPGNTDGDLECRCNNGFEEVFGSNPLECVDINECLVDVLSCDPLLEDCVNNVGGFECKCKDGFKYPEGENSGSADCININECEDQTDDCHRSSLCEDTFGSYTCTCVNGFIGNGKDCQPECPDCGENGRCVIISQDLPTGGTGLFTYCKCADGYTTNADGKCEDVDECLLDLCGPNTDCENFPGSYLCPCADGFTENAVGICDDVDECSLDPNPCDGNADCLNTFGSYLCTCNEGYAGDGECCKPECPDCGINAHCVIENNQSSCVCKAGYDGDPLVECEDVDECDNLMNDCWITNDLCVNLPGSYLCTCPDGFARDPDTGICEDRDECSDTTHNCGTNAICENTEGSWTCECPTGYEGNGLFCVSKKEIVRCTEDCLDTEQCVYDLDSDEYRCECAAGYEADVDGVCVDINECKAVVCDAGYTCTNYPGGYDCVCPPGFEHDPITSTCIDIDECLTKQHDCAETAFCTNLSGSYLCTCETGYTGNGRTCEKTVICGEIDLCHPTATCDELTSAQDLYSCTCPPGTTGNGFDKCEDNVAVCEPSCGTGKMCVLGSNGQGICICQEGYEAKADGSCSDVDECETIGCSNGMECVNLPGSFQCLCAPGTEAKISSTGDVVCGDTNECSADNMCSSNANCIDLNMAVDGEPYRCECKEGYHGTGTTCCDTNECGDESHNCDENATCKNTEGSYECYCKTGWEGNGKQCNPICPEKQKIGADGETCECKNGYRPVDPPGDELECEDIDECTEELHNCDVNGICLNTDGSYICDGCVDPWHGSGYKNECCEEECGSNQACFFMECKCKPGYYKDYITGECFPYCDPVCSRLEVCDKGRCVCKKGYTRNILGECEKVPCDCHDLAQCEVTTNSLGQMLDAECVCNSGFEGDGVDSCEDINECDVDPTICGENIACCNLYGDFVCVCPCGYQYVEETQSCIDIDECASGSHACDETQDCFNQDGYHECACRPEDCGLVLANKRIEMRLPCVKPEPYNP
ncbi:Oidioi.mRNA.OKI2018_I69.chr1.g300.t1.cds [Oikopleura dioica]|uniref:Oidioi.mRNA.OKI2018_I69.chr1.g300.t1.cds n=1 Tax=Oikopleura dioica TaxID=34765 RepID=A0ABN7SQN9_OIKDI|nr:Oidioi.mRNA.OKI2018_I69.chr1.g300.t1.cds [Oikopleura dioica]